MERENVVNVATSACSPYVPVPWHLLSLMAFSLVVSWHLLNYSHGIHCLTAYPPVVPCHILNQSHSIHSIHLMAYSGNIMTQSFSWHVPNLSHGIPSICLMAYPQSVSWHTLILSHAFNVSWYTPKLSWHILESVPYLICLMTYLILMGGVGVGVGVRCRCWVLGCWVLKFNSLRPSDAYMRRYKYQHWCR